MEARLGDVAVLEHPVFSNGIVYVGLAFDTVDLGNEESALLPLLGTAMLRAFGEAAASLDSVAIDDRALDAVRIGAIGGFDAILGPAEQLETAHAWHWIGLTDTQRQAFREGLFSVCAADVRRDALPIVQAGMAGAGIAVLGPRSMLEAAGSIAG